MYWQNESQIEPLKFRCGYCDNVVATDRGFFDNAGVFRAYPCPNCHKMSFFDNAGNQTPGIAPGNVVEHLPEQLDSLYNEARRCVSVNAFTAAVLACRKLLMHIAAEQGAESGKPFIFYVEFLAENGFVPPNGKGWVDHIRKKGNEANHEIILMSVDDATELISFSEMLLKFVYEFPARILTE